jgi:carboxyl-terminal processing protease
MNKRPYIYLPIFFALVLILGMLLGTLLIPAISSKNGLFSVDLKNYDKINDVINYIEDEYVDSTSHESLERTAINELLQSLDPHSIYIPAEDFNEANDPLKGNFDGIGIQFRIIRDSITVISVIHGGPSEKEGLIGGDRIVTIDGKKAAGVKITDDEAIKKLKGPSGSKVKVGIFRKGQKNLLSISITRGNIPTHSVDFSYMATKDIGYVKLSRFSNNTGDEFVQDVKNLENMGMRKLIIDLRGNGGGVMDAAIEIADQFLSDQKLIVYTEGYHKKKENYFATSEGDLENTKLVILIDEFSASASEILAGAIQDNDRGSIIGRRSFGKGLVQEQIQLPDQSAIRLTIARYHTPTGRCIQKPYTADVEKYYADFYKQFLSDEEYQDSMNFVDTLRFTTPGGKVVYGGGGIMPDYYVSAKSEYSSQYYKILLSKGVINNFAFDYADRHRQSLAVYKNAEGFVRNFQVSSSLFEELIVFAEKNNVKRNAEDIRTSENVIKTELKAQIGRVIYDDPAFYPLILPDDKIFQKAIEVLNSGK